MYPISTTETTNKANEDYSDIICHIVAAWDSALH